MTEPMIGEYYKHINSHGEILVFKIVARKSYNSYWCETVKPPINSFYSIGYKFDVNEVHLKQMTKHIPNYIKQLNTEKEVEELIK